MSAATAPLRPSDADALNSTLRSLRSQSAVPVLFGGESTAQTMRLSSFIGMRTNAMRGLDVEYGRGLGGRVMHNRRPAVVEDYTECEAITADYRDAVNRESLRTIIAVPVVVGDESRAVIYGALRSVTEMGDRVTRFFHSAARELATEFRVRDDVDRRLSMAEVARSETRYGLEATDREQLRQLHGELRAIAAELDDPALKGRLLAAGTALAGVGRPEDEEAPSVNPVRLSPREIDVLSQVALGCSNSEAGARLSLSAETIKAYLRNIGAKLETRTRMESVARARLLGLLP